MLHDTDRKLSKCALTKTADHEMKEPKLSVAELCVVCEGCCNGLFPTVQIFPTGFIPQSFYFSMRVCGPTPLN